MFVHVVIGLIDTDMLWLLHNHPSKLFEQGIISYLRSVICYDVSYSISYNVTHAFFLDCFFLFPPSFHQDLAVLHIYGAPLSISNIFFIVSVLAKVSLQRY